MIHLHLSHQNFYSPPQSHLIFFRTYQLFVTYRGGGGILWWGGGGERWRVHFYLSHQTVIGLFHSLVVVGAVEIIAHRIWGTT